MAIKKLKPNTNAQRFTSVDDFSDLTTDKPNKRLLLPNNKKGGRNNSGKMTMRYIGGGHKKKYRIVDFSRDKYDIEATVKTIEYDPNRTCRISLVYYADGEKRYILSPKGIKVGDKIISSRKEIEPNIGNTTTLKNIPLGTSVHNIELKQKQGGKLARSAGSYAQLSNKENNKAVLKLPSGETRIVSIECLATIGVVSNSEHNLKKIGKAGRKRWLGRRPRTRGVAMNPVDHPMGGGEGRASGGHPRSRKGIPAKGFKTRKNKHSDKFIIERRKK